MSAFLNTLINNVVSGAQGAVGGAGALATKLTGLLSALGLG